MIQCLTRSLSRSRLHPRIPFDNGKGNAMTSKLLLPLAFAISLTAIARAGPSPSLDTIQVKYSDPTDGNVVLVTWERTAAGSAPASILVDGSSSLSVTSREGFNIAEVPQVPGGKNFLGFVEGGTVQVGFLSQEVLSSPPIGDVSLDCTVDEDDCEIIVNGESPGPPSSYVEFVIDDIVQPLQSEMLFDNDAGVFKFSGTFRLETSGQHQVTAYALGERGDGGSFENGSYRQDGATSCASVCGSGGSVSFVPGLCNGAGTGPSGRQPDISSAVFGLSWLFAGTRAPPCAAACDANGDGEVDISDMVRVLNYLFSGGAPPDGWVDSSGDGVADPTCKLPAAGDDCAAGHDACGG
jgi:hypothetical protein